MRYLYQLTFLFALGFAVPTAMAQKATVKATALDDHRASIEWTGKASQWTVERKAWNDDFEILATLPGEVHSISIRP
jgi:hypothetical protein